MRTFVIFVWAASAIYAVEHCDTGISPPRPPPAGNVREWCADWYRADYYEQIAASGAVVRNPQGPADSFDPGEPGVAKRVQKGGSFLCTGQYCSRYMPGARGKGEASTGTNHVGFRCVR